MPKAYADSFLTEGIAHYNKREYKQAIQSLDKSIAAKPTVELEYLAGGQVVGKGALELPAADAQGRIPYTMSSPAESMPPGEYEIRATVKQGDTTAEEKTTIKVESL